MLNKQITEGRLTADPELKHTAEDVPVCSFSIASQEDFVRKNGERDTDFVECVAWRGKAEFVVRNCKKGQLVIVEGRPKTRKYTDSNGVERKTTELNVENVYLTTFNGDNTAEGADAAPNTKPALQSFDDDSDIPF